MLIFAQVCDVQRMTLHESARRAARLCWICSEAVRAAKRYIEEHRFLELIENAAGRWPTMDLQRPGRLAQVHESQYQHRHCVKSVRIATCWGEQAPGIACRLNTFSRYILKSTRKLFSTLQICRKHPRSQNVVRGMASAAELHLYLDVLLHRAVRVNDDCEKEVEHAPEPLG
jgi:hypothetical protein